MRSDKVDLIKYNNKKIKLIDLEGKVYISKAYYSDAETNESEEDILIIKNGNEYYEIYESDIQSIEILD